MTLSTKIDSFAKLGLFLRQFASTPYTPMEEVAYNSIFFDRFEQLINQQIHINGWFTPEQVQHAIKSWSEALSETSLKKWTENYSFNEEPKKNIALILAGNIPMVGFHDILCVLISGNIAQIKYSSNDSKLIDFLLEYLCAITPEFLERIQKTEGKLENFDAVIATGSNNSARYFDYYFGKYPHIIRKNRNSVAVLTGNETKEELKNLGEDIFRYFGLGCRSVSKIFVPKGYDFKLFFEAIFAYKDVIFYEKYANNYDYNKAVYLMSEFEILDNEFLILKEDYNNYASPIGTLFYAYYDDMESLNQQLKEDAEKIQCIVSDDAPIDGAIKLGSSQTPHLWDYADGVDTLLFLNQL